MKLSALLEQQFNLPSIPKVVALLLTELERPEADLRRITQLISTDPALTTRLLQLANSNFFRLSGRIHSVSEALAGVIHLATWRARGKEAKLTQRELAVSFPDDVGVALSLDIDMVLQQDPFDWAAHT